MVRLVRIHTKMCKKSPNWSTVLSAAVDRDMDGSQKNGVRVPGAECYPKQLTKPRSMVAEMISTEERVCKAMQSSKVGDNLS